MRRTLLIIAAVALALLLFLSSFAIVDPPPPVNSAGQQVRVTQVDTGNYPQITIYVAATDANGAPVGGLNQNAFTVTEDGMPVEISDFTGGGSGPISTVLVIDHSGSMDDDDKMEGAQAAARTFANEMRPIDETALIGFSDDVRVRQNFTADQTILTEAIDELRASGGTALYDSIIEGVGLIEGRSGRRVLLLLTDGEDKSSTTTLNRALDYTVARGQPIYVIGLGERGLFGDGFNEEVLQRIATETGGEYFHAPRADELAALYARLAGGLQEEYSLTYTSPRPFNDGTRRDIRVSIGAQTAASAYTEQHLIKVATNPLVGIMLLGPLVVLLLLPDLARRRWKRLGDPAPAAAAPPPAQPEAAAPAPAQPAPVHATPTLTVIPGDVPHCVACDTPLRPDARFCNKCGATQAAPEPALATPRRIFCDQCGRPLRPGARFCNECGASAPVNAGSLR